MVVVIGTNAGFVTVSPTTDPEGASTLTLDDVSTVIRDTSPATAAKIIEIGWYCENATEAANFEVGLYAADGASVPGEAGTLLHVERTHAKGTDAGWKTATVDWEIDGSTDYWIAVQIDNTTTGTKVDIGVADNPRDSITNSSTLPDPFGGGAFSSTVTVAFYALWEVGVAGTNHQIISGNGLSWFTTEYFGVWITLFSFVVLSIINTFKQFSIG